MLGGLFAQAAQGIRTHEASPTIPAVVFLDIGFPVAVFGALAGAGVCLVIAAGARDRAARRLAERLGTLPAAQCREVLASLEGDRLRDTRVIARELARRLGAAQEIAPASAPDGRGDEAAEA
jgi:hypothetical protein